MSIIGLEGYYTIDYILLGKKLIQSSQSSYDHSGHRKNLCKVRKVLMTIQVTEKTYAKFAKF